MQVSGDASEVDTTSTSSAYKGEDAAAFDVDKQDLQKWTFFTVELIVVLGILYGVGFFVSSFLLVPMD